MWKVVILAPSALMLSVIVLKLRGAATSGPAEESTWPCSVLHLQHTVDQFVCAARLLVDSDVAHDCQASSRPW